MPPDSKLELQIFLKNIWKQTDESKLFFSTSGIRDVSDNTSCVKYKLKSFMLLIHRVFWINMGTTDEAQLLVSNCWGTVAYFHHLMNEFHAYSYTKNWIINFKHKIQLNYEGTLICCTQGLLMNNNTSNKKKEKMLDTVVFLKLYHTVTPMGIMSWELQGIQYIESTGLFMF